MKPANILFILIDDLGWKDLSCYGSDFHETPHLDKLAQEGMTFTDAYASCPVCSPTRASVLTGRYPARVGVTDYIGAHRDYHLCTVPYHRNLPLSEISIAHVLGENNYQTWHVGKWHLGDHRTHPEKHGFQKNIGGCHMGMPENGFFSPWNIPKLENGEEGEYLTDHLTDKAITLIQERDTSKPFFLNLWHYGVHTPIQAPEPLVQKYKEKAQRLKLDQKNPFKIVDAPSLGHTIECRTFQSDPVYAAMIENLDTNIGRLLKALKAESLDKDTLIIFTSDNGGLATDRTASPTCNSPLAQGKGWNYEGGTRVPLLAYWPGKIQPDSACDTPVTSTDFFPTFLDAANTPLLPELHCDGESLMPLLKGETHLKREAIFWHYPHYSNAGGSPACSIRAGDWKLIEFFEDDSLELYNLKEDISEERNVSAEQPEITQKLKRLLDNWKDSVKALIPPKNSNFERMMRYRKKAKTEKK